MLINLSEYLSLPILCDNEFFDSEQVMVCTSLPLSIGPPPAPSYA